jgi:hypothetical protein
VRRIGIENPADLSDTGVAQMALERAKSLGRSELSRG